MTKLFLTRHPVKKKRGVFDAVRGGRGACRRERGPYYSYRRRKTGEASTAREKRGRIHVSYRSGGRGVIPIYR